MITYESMKMFLVTFAIEALVILIAVAIIYNVYSALRGIVRMVKRHRDKQKALDKIYRATALFRKMDCHALDFPDATFDLIISRNVVWTLYDPTKAYGEWTRVLKPKSSIVVFDAAWNKEFHNQSIMDRKNAARRSLGKKEMAQYLGDQDLCEELDQRSVLGNEDRPAWDRACLEKLGLDVKIDEKAYMTLWDEETRLLNEATPLFMIQASKR